MWLFQTWQVLERFGLSFSWTLFLVLRVSSIVLYQFKDFGKSALALVIGSLMSLVSRFMLIEFSTSSVSWLVSFTTLQRKIFFHIYCKLPHSDYHTHVVIFVCDH